SKPILNGTDEKARQSRQRLLFILLVNSIKLLHPFMPFVTEELWTFIDLPKKQLLIVEKWPVM
ncbi:MAG TPA: class I tRNA ligase family protein, partial [Candidatus Nanoarchaeia archaeon]|nr:class I tRNA ligase family protein [Candidatus Nanoarchaeia archaeon]